MRIIRALSIYPLSYVFRRRDFDELLVQIVSPSNKRGNNKPINGRERERTYIRHVRLFTRNGCRLLMARGYRLRSYV